MHDIFDVFLHGLFRNTQANSDFLVGFAFHETPDDTHLAIGQSELKLGLVDLIDVPTADLFHNDQNACRGPLSGGHADSP